MVAACPLSTATVVVRPIVRLIIDGSSRFCRRAASARCASNVTWCYHRHAVQGGSRRQTIVVGHDAIELVAQFQSCGKVESVQAAHAANVSEKESRHDHGR